MPLSYQYGHTVCLAQAHFCPPCTNGLRKQSSQLVVLPFPAVKPVPSLDKLLQAESCDYCKLNGVCGLSHEHVEDGYKGIRVKFGAKNPTELGIW